MAGFFGQVGDLIKLQKEAKEMEKKMKRVHITGYSDDENVKIVMNGVQEIEEMEIKDEIITVGRKKELVREIKGALKDAQKKLQKEMSKDMDIDKLKGMLGAR